MSAITPLIDGLARRGWLSRSPDPDDRRRTVLELTPAGTRALQAGRLRTRERLTDVLRHGDPSSPGLAVDVAAVAAWLEQAVQRYDRHRLEGA